MFKKKHYKQMIHVSILKIVFGWFYNAVFMKNHLKGTVAIKMCRLYMFVNMYVVSIGLEVKKKRSKAK